MDKLTHLTTGPHRDLMTNVPAAIEAINMKQPARKATQLTRQLSPSGHVTIDGSAKEENAQDGQKVRLTPTAKRTGHDETNSRHTSPYR